MNIQTIYNWQKEGGEEVELRIGGEYTPAGQPTEFEHWQGDSVSLDWIEDVFGNRWAGWNFQPHELEAMRLKLLEAAREKLAAAKNESLRGFSGLRKMLNLSEF